jgi:hypothetical protein
VAWLDLRFFNKTAERIDRNEHSRTDLHVFKLTVANKMADLALRNADPSRKLPWSFEALFCHCDQ